MSVDDLLNILIRHKQTQYHNITETTLISQIDPQKDTIIEKETTNDRMAIDTISVKIDEESGLLVCFGGIESS